MEKIKNHFKVFWYMYVLAAILAAMLAVYCRIIDLEEQNTNYIISIYHLTDLDTEDIFAVSFKGKAGQELAFSKKEDGTWIYTANEDIEIEQAGPQYLAELLKEVTSEYQIENAEDINLYGLHEACPYVQVDTEAMRYRIYIGNYNQTVRKYYAYMEGSSIIYGVGEEIAEVLDYTLDDFLLDETE